MPRSRAAGIDAGRTRNSASKITANMESGSHELTVSYPGTTGLGVGKFFRSAAFSVGGQRWFIRYYPDGFTTESADYISVYLALDSTDEQCKNANVIAQFRLDLLDHQTGAPVPAYTVTSSKHNYCGSDRSWGYAKFIERRELAESNLIQDGSFQISCNVTVFDIRTESTPVCIPDAPSPSMDLHQDLGHLLETKLGADVLFMVGIETFAAHRYVLAARSPVFKAELFGWMKEKKAAQIQIEDMEPRVFAAMLHFVYTNSFPPIEEADTRVMAEHLLVAADRYQLEGMKTICEDVLRKCIDTDTAATTLVLAEQHGCHRLKEGCFSFLKYPGNVKAVMATDGFNHLMSNFPSLVKELLAKVSP